MVKIAKEMWKEKDNTNRRKSAQLNAEFQKEGKKKCVITK